MRIAVDGAFGGVENMSRDVALLAEVDSSGGAAARIYGWDRPWVSLGRFQSADRDLLPDCPAPWVVRPTGGRAVLHGHDLTLAIAVAYEAWPAVPSRRSPRALARELTRPIARALADCGVVAMPGEETGRHFRSTDCFAHAAPTDLADTETGTKLCGAALRLTDRAVLLQASIPLGPPLIDPALVFAAPAVPHMRPIDRTVLERGLVESLMAWTAHLEPTLVP